MIKIDRKVKTIVILGIISSCLWIIYAFNTDNADYAAYAKWYMLTGSGGRQDRFEIGYTLFMVYANKLGLNFQQFLMIYSGIGIFLIAQSLYRYCNYPSFAMLLYFLYPFFFDIVQIRNFMAEAIIFFALRYLEKFNIKNLAIFLLLVLLACTFHKTAIVSLMYLFGYFKDYTLTLRISLYVTLAGILIFLFIPLGKITTLLMDFVAVEYLEEGSSIGKVMGYVMISIVIICAIYYFYYRKNRKSRMEEKNFLIFIVPVLIFFCVLIGLSSQAYRFFRNMMLIVYVAILNIGVEINGKIIKFNSYQLFLTVVAIGVAIFLFGRQLSWIAPLYETVTEPIIKSNSLFFGN